MPDNERQLGAARGAWWWIALSTIALVVIAVITVFILVSNGQLGRVWAYVVLPLGIIAAASTRVLTVFKAAAENKRT